MAQNSRFTMNCSAKLPALILCMLCCLIFSNTNIARAKEDVDAINFVEEVIGAVQDIFNKKSTEEQKRREFIELINNKVDTEWFTAFIIGNNRNQFSAQQLDDFNQHYKEFALNLYYSALAYVQGKKLSIIKSEPKKNNRYQVFGAVVSPTDHSVIQFEVRVHTNKDNKFLIQDVVTSGISLAVSQRSEVDAAIKNKGIPALLARIKNSRNSAIPKAQYKKT